MPNAYRSVVALLVIGVRFGSVGAQEEAVPHTAPVPVQVEEFAGVDPRLTPPRPVIRGFSDITLRLEGDVREDESNPDTFSLGQTDLLITSQLAPGVSVLGELVFKFGDDNSSEFSLERLHLQYSLSDRLTIRAGRMHAPLGHWNQTFHHGAWFQTTIDRPRLHTFDGILPIHTVGLEVFGRREFRGFDLDYNVTLANGRGTTPSETQNVRDRNGSKAINLLVGIAPHRVPGLRAGVNAYFDRIPPDETRPARSGSIDETIVGGHLVYQRRDVEVLAELSRIDHDDQASGQSFETLGFYLQGACQVREKWQPYYRFDFVDFGAGDPFYTPFFANIDIARHTLGVRWDTTTWTAFKLEYSYSDRDAARDTHAVNAQVSFTF